MLYLVEYQVFVELCFSSGDYFYIISIFAGFKFKCNGTETIDSKGYKRLRTS